jgi:hypothetical protein
MNSFRLNSGFTRKVREIYRISRLQAPPGPGADAEEYQDYFYAHQDDECYWELEFHRDQHWSQADWDLIYETPHAGVITNLIEVCYWASLGTEEGRSISFRLMFSPPFYGRDSLVLEKPIGFNTNQLIKFAPAVHSPQSVIGVWYINERELGIWGFTGSVRSRAMWLSLKTFGPGHLLLDLPMQEQNSYSGREERPRALISGSKVSFLGSIPNPFSLPTRVGKFGLPDLRSLRLLSLGGRRSLRRTVQQMWELGLGGILLVVFDDDENWKDSIRTSLCLGPKQVPEVPKWEKRKESKDAVKAAVDDVERFYVWEERLQHYTTLLAKLTAIDGATVVNHSGSVLAFGAKIRPADSNIGPDKVLVSDLIEQTEELVSLASLGGTRHQSAAQFVFDQPDSLAIVVSQDRRVSVMRYNKDRTIVEVTKHAEYVF